MSNLVKDCIKLGFGMMRLPRIEGTNTIDLEQTKRMVDAPTCRCCATSFIVLPMRSKSST